MARPRSANAEPATQPGVAAVQHCAVTNVWRADPGRRARALPHRRQKDTRRSTCLPTAPHPPPPGHKCRKCEANYGSPPVSPRLAQLKRTRSAQTDARSNASAQAPRDHETENIADMSRAIGGTGASKEQRASRPACGTSTSAMLSPFKQWRVGEYNPAEAPRRSTSPPRSIAFWRRSRQHVLPTLQPRWLCTPPQS